MDIVIFGGQSNMQGQTEGLPKNNQTVNGALEYRFLTDKLIPLQHPVGEDIAKEQYLLASHEGGGCLVPAFCRAYVEKTGRQVTAIHVARGNTSLAEWQEGTNRFNQAVEKIRAGIEKVKRAYTIEHIYYVWLQGETDAILGTTEEAYLDGLIRYKNSLKKEVGIEKFGIIKVGYFYCTSQWHSAISSYEEKKKNDETIMRAQERAVKEDSDFVMLTEICETMSLQKEYINPKASGHYNNLGMEIIGELAGETLANIH